MKENIPSQEEKIIVSVDSDLEDLIPDFLENRRTDIKSMRRALSEGDFDKIRITGHSMKGSGGGYGFDEITEIGKYLEDAANERNAEEIIRRVDELVSYLDRVEVVYE
ncbi:MAG: hypothetical protein IEMM0002_1391 [bacterium]|nr:MAG: hypothetical protein IEMM0002_1391 [bacterium]